MGGEHAVDEEPEQLREGPQDNCPMPIARMTIEAATSILRRDDEVAAAQKRQPS